jgi:hypothetical protein
MSLCWQNPAQVEACEICGTPQPPTVALPAQVACPSRCLCSRGHSSNVCVYAQNQAASDGTPQHFELFHFNGIEGHGGVLAAVNKIFVDIIEADFASPPSHDQGRGATRYST